MVAKSTLVESVVFFFRVMLIILCPNVQKKLHCMLARRAAFSQLRLDNAIGRNVHTTRFNGRECSYLPLQRAKCSYRPLQREKCSYRPTLDCPRLTTRSHAIRLFPSIWTQNVVCTSSDMVSMWQRNVMQKLNCACAYNHTAERYLLLILLLLRTALAPYW